jgi:hypothetical protein
VEEEGRGDESEKRKKMERSERKIMVEKRKWGAI